MKQLREHTSLKTSTTRSNRTGNNITIRIRDNRLTRSQDKNNNKLDQVVVIVARTMKLLYVVRPQALVSDMGHWTMQLGIAHSYKIKATEISKRGKQPFKHHLRTKQDNFSSSNNKAYSKHIIRMPILLSSNRIEMHKGGRIDHSSKGVHTILIVSMQMLRVML